MAKWSGIAGTQSKYETLIKKISTLPLLNSKRQGILTRLGVRQHGDYPWIDPNLVGMPDVAELSVLWMDDLEFSFLNHDCAGFNYADMFARIDEFVSTPIAISPSSISDALNRLTSSLLGQR